MANIALKTANRVEVVESIEQLTATAAEDITAGAPVRIDTATGKFTNANGTSTAEARAYGIATKTVKSGLPVTAIAKGVLDGFTFTQDYDATIFVSDTDGRLGDAAGTVNKVAGRVIPGFATTTGTAADKLLRVEL